MPQLVSRLGFAARKVIPRKNVCVGGMRFLHERGQRFRPDVSRGLDFHGDYFHAVGLKEKVQLAFQELGGVQ